MKDCNHKHITTSVDTKGYKIYVCEDCGDELE